MQRIHTSVCLLALVAASLAACRRTSVVSYKVKNLAADSIRIICARTDAPLLFADTFYLSYNQTATIAIVDKGKGHVSNYKQTGTVMEDLRSVEVYRIGSGTRARANLLLTGAWTYVEHGATRADYVATLTEKDL
ncbi:hypothetical protein [Nemorincola caseinilytica]